MNVYKKAVLLGAGMGIVGACTVFLFSTAGVPYPFALAVAVAMVAASMALLGWRDGGHSKS